MAQIGSAAVSGWDFPRGAASILLMVGFAAEHGIPAHQALAGSGLTMAQVEDPAAQVDAQQELAVVRALQRHLADLPGFGLRIGTRYQVTSFGIFGFACLSSPTLRDVISFALRFWDLGFAFAIPSVEQHGDTLSITLDDHAIPVDVRTLLVERDLAAMFTVMNALLPAPISLRRLDFRHHQPSYVDAYTAVFGLCPTFDAPANLSTFDSALLDAPLPLGNAQTVALCEEQCRELVARRRARTGLAGEVRDRLIRVGPTTPMDHLARDLGLSTRTLRRRLDESGTSYRALLDEVRETLAEELLATGALSVSDVAVRLGYAESASFITAFKRWKGTTPTSYARTRSTG